MSQLSLAALRLDAWTSHPEVAGPAPRVDEPLSPEWAAQVARLEAVVEKACAGLARRERRARSLTVTVRLANGKRMSRTLTLPRATEGASGVMPAALGLLWLLTAGGRQAPSRIGVRFGELVEGANQPISFQRYLAKKRPQGMARLAGLVASLGLFGSLIGGR